MFAEIFAMLREYDIDEQRWLEEYMIASGANESTPPHLWQAPANPERFLPWNMSQEMLSRLQKQPALKTKPASNERDGERSNQNQQSSNSEQHGPNCNCGAKENKQPTSPASDGIREKIRKLLALADGNANEHERDVAMQAAAELLAKHNLEMTEVSGASFAGLQTSEYESDFKLDPWIRALLKSCCQLYYTDYFVRITRDQFGDRRERSAVFVGTDENIAVTIEMAKWLIASVRKESNRLFKEEFERRSFRLGAAHRIAERVRQMLEAEKVNQAGGTAAGTSLMVVRNRLVEANEKHLANLDLRPLAQRRSTYLNRDAYAEGQQYGDELELERKQASVHRPALAAGVS